MSKSTAPLSSLYENVVLTLEEIDINLDKAEKELGKISRLRGLEAIDIRKAQEEFQAFKKDYEAQKKALKESVISMKKEE